MDTNTEEKTDTILGGAQAGEGLAALVGDIGKTLDVITPEQRQQLELISIRVADYKKRVVADMVGEAGLLTNSLNGSIAICTLEEAELALRYERVLQYLLKGDVQ